MSDTLLTIVVCYDISRSRTRRRVASFLEERMVRVQKSVFECQVTLKAANRLFDRVDMMMDEGDRARMYVMTKSGLSKSRSTGGTPLPEEAGFWLL